jgi:hypothetical protein
VIAFVAYHPYASDFLGFIPQFLSERDPRPAKEQINERYAHGGGWFPFEGFKMNEDRSIQYPGDSSYPLVAEARLRDETILVYPHAWVAIMQKDGTFEISRMD